MEVKFCQLNFDLSFWISPNWIWKAWSDFFSEFLQPEFEKHGVTFQVSGTYKSYWFSTNSGSIIQEVVHGSAPVVQMLSQQSWRYFCCCCCICWLPCSCWSSVQQGGVSDFSLCCRGSDNRSLLALVFFIEGFGAPVFAVEWSNMLRTGLSMAGLLLPPTKDTLLVNGFEAVVVAVEWLNIFKNSGLLPPPPPRNTLVGRPMVHMMMSWGWGTRVTRVILMVMVLLLLRQVTTNIPHLFFTS